MFSVTKEIQKQQFDKSKVDRWVSMLYDIWGTDVETIHRKLRLKAQDVFVWSSEVDEYIYEKVCILMN